MVASLLYTRDNSYKELMLPCENGIPTLWELCGVLRTYLRSLSFSCSTTPGPSVGSWDGLQELRLLPPKEMWSRSLQPPNSQDGVLILLNPIAKLYWSQSFSTVAVWHGEHLAFQCRLVHLIGVCVTVWKNIFPHSKTHVLPQLHRSDFFEDCSKNQLLKHSRLKEPPPLPFKKRCLCRNYHQRNQSLFSTTAFQVLPTTDSVFFSPLLLYTSF